MTDSTPPSDPKDPNFIPLHVTHLFKRRSREEIAKAVRKQAEEYRSGAAREKEGESEPHTVIDTEAALSEMRSWYDALPKHKDETPLEQTKRRIDEADPWKQLVGKTVTSVYHTSTSLSMTFDDGTRIEIGEGCAGTMRSPEPYFYKRLKKKGER